MGSDWKEVSLGEIGRVVTGKTPKTKVIENFGHEIPFITPRDMDDQRIISETERYLSKVGSVSVKNSIIPANSISVSCIGSDMGKSAITKYLSVTNQQINSIVVSDEFYYKFVYYNLSSRKAEIRGLAGGSAQPILNKSDFSQIKMFVPPLTEQKAIAHILGSLDDKIELNRQMNETLEAMAQTLFKSWFVDFDPVIDNALAAGNAIPDELLERAEQRKEIEKKDNSDIQSLFPAEFEFTKEMGWIPKGWSIKKAEEIASITIGKTPPRKESKWFSDTQKDNLVWVSIRDMGNSNVFINDSSEYLTKESIKKFNVKVIPRNSVMLSFKLTLGRVLIAQKELTTNEAIAHFCNPQFSMSKEYIYCYLSNFKYDSLGSTSSIATAVNSKIIKGMPFIVPSEQVLSAFETLSKIYFDKISLVNQQIDSLANLRDTLLPKLMSGELRIADAEVLVDEIL